MKITILSLFSLLSTQNAFVSHSNVDNRGRVCIGDLSVYCEPN